MFLEAFVRVDRRAVGGGLGTVGPSQSGRKCGRRARVRVQRDGNSGRRGLPGPGTGESREWDGSGVVRGTRLNPGRRARIRGWRDGDSGQRGSPGPRTGSPRGRDDGGVVGGPGSVRSGGRV